MAPARAPGAASASWRRLGTRCRAHRLRLPALLLAALVALPAVALAQEPAPPPLFADRAAEAGLAFHHFNGASGELYYAEMMGPGAALFDADGDGDLDAYLLQGQMLGPGKTVADALAAPGHPLPLTDRLYRNDTVAGPGDGRRLRFTDVTAEAGLVPGDYAYGVAAGDYDNDGATDLYVAAFGANRLLHNRGGGVFEDVTERSGTGDPRWSVAAVFFDYDRDGWLDLYVVNYVDFHTGKHRFCPDPTGARDYCGPSAYEPVGDRLFHNRGDGSFEDATAGAGVAALAGPGLGVAAADWTGDGWPDLYVANDGSPNFLLVNQRDGSFRDQALLAGCAVNAEGMAEASMGVAVGDADGDGRLDLFVTHLNNETNTLYLGDGRGLFRDATEASGLGTPSWLYTGFGTGFVDLGRDGDLDLVVVDGAVTRFAGRGSLAQSDQLFRNLGDGRFAEATAAAGPAFTRPAASRGAAFGDVDDDGDTDLLVVDNGGPARLLVNESAAAGGWLGLRLVTGAPPRDALGAVAALQRPGRRDLVRLAASGGSYASASDPRALFGLGDDRAAAFTAEVTWPDGRVESFSGLAPGRYHTLEQGKGRQETAPHGEEKREAGAPGTDRRRGSPDHLDPGSEAGRRGEGPVAGEERGAQRFGEGDVGGVVGGEVVAQRPHPGQQQVMGPPAEVELAQVFEGQAAPLGAEVPVEDVAPDHLRDLDVHEVGSVERDPGRADALGDAAPGSGGEEQLEDRRGVEDDQRPSRSARRTTAGGGSSSTSGS